jgi:hypothetical protein
MTEKKEKLKGAVQEVRAAFINSPGTMEKE